MIMNTTEGGDSLDDPDVTPEELYVVMCLLSLLSVMGTAGNALVLYVFAKKKDKLVSTLFILVLAFVDFTTCLVVIPFTMYMEYTRFRIDYDLLCKTYQFLITSNIPFSALIMAAIAIDRYLCICHPFLHALNLERAKYVTAGLGLFSIGLGIVVALMYGIYTIPGDNSDDSVTTPAATSLTSIVMTTGENLTINHKYLTLTYELDTEVMSRQLNATTLSGSNATEATIKTLTAYEFTGICLPNNMLLGETFLHFYQKFYIALFLLCLIVVIFLYSLIYSSVLQRRSKRQKQKSKALSLVQSEAMTNSPETIVTVVNGDKTFCSDNKLTVVNGDALSTESQQVSENDESRPALRPPKKHKRAKRNSLKKALKQKTAKKDRTLMANIKTAAMLFVVTLVFIATFLPAFLIALEIVPYNIIVFNMYFANNVANPIIYSFMNKNFRDDLRKIFCRRV